MAASLSELNIIRHCSDHLSELAKEGYEVEAPDDFGRISDMVGRTGRRRQTPMMTLARNDFTRKDAFWFFLMRDSEPVAGTAAMYIDLGGESFDSYLRRTSQEQYHRDEDPIAAIAPPVNAHVQGRLIYLGELEMHPGHRGRPRTLFRFARVMMGLSALKWPEFDVMYAFVPKEHLKLADGYGFTWRVPRAITWAEPVPKGRLNDHWLVATSRDDFVHAWAGAKPFDS